MKGWELWVCTKGVASFPDLPVFCISVCLDISTRMRKSGRIRARPGIIHHVVMSGGCEVEGP